MTGHACDVIGIGASAGGVQALLELLPLLPGNLPASILIVIHRHPTAESSLSAVLSRRALLAVCEPRNGDALQEGVVYVAPRDQHMRVARERIWLDRSPKQHHTRPVIDPLFHSIAALGERGAGVLLSGSLSDGVSGLIAIREAGGRTVAQDPAEAPFPAMPLNAIRADDVERVLKLRDIAPFLEHIARDDERVAPGPVT